MLRAFVQAHAQPHPNTRDREPLMFIQNIGGSSIEHHAIDTSLEGVDEAFLEDMHGKGFISIDYREHSWNITPTEFGRNTVAESERVFSTDAVADVEPFQLALANQADSGNPLGRPPFAPCSRRSVDTGRRGGSPSTASSSPPSPRLSPMISCHSSQRPYGSSSEAVPADRGHACGGHRGRRRPHNAPPRRIAITEKAHAVLDGWPGPRPEELVENLLAAIAVAAADEPDQARKRGLERLGETIGELGVSVTSEVIAKVADGRPDVRGGWIWQPYYRGTTSTQNEKRLPGGWRRSLKAVPLQSVAPSKEGAEVRRPQKVQGMDRIGRCGRACAQLLHRRRPNSQNWSTSLLTVPNEGPSTSSASGSSALDAHRRGQVVGRRSSEAHEPEIKSRWAARFATMRRALSSPPRPFRRRRGRRTRAKPPTALRCGQPSSGRSTPLDAS